MLADTDLATCEVLRPERRELRADVPAGPETNTLTASMRRTQRCPRPYGSVWTFRSGTTAKEQPLPLLTVGYEAQALGTAWTAAVPNSAGPGLVSWRTVVTGTGGTGVISANCW
ncbi:hypothetical protein [Nonomuraea fuscirosea]|uniref:hypothetical protein n=1 Tax=Nonomuraea fuscirosea TaxID=1291556 RepID=UPI003423B97B